MKARKLWENLLEVRYRTGEPYLNFIDTANRYLPETQKKLGLKINGSNLCNEIHLVTDKDRTAVCCLSSVNIEKFDEWKQSTMVRDLIRFLDNVLQVFIDNAPDTISRAKFSAERERSLGLGAMGLHSYFQKCEASFESEHASELNKRIFQHIKQEAVAETKKIAKEKGEAPDMVGSGFRNAHLLAIAPNANSGVIAGTSPSIEPSKANAYTHRTRVGSYLVKNRYLEKLLKDIGQDTQDTWSSIITNGGSVQHLDFLNAHQKRVFATANEIPQMSLVR